jgi:hypothetical protein
MMQSVSSPGAVGRRAPARRSTAAVRALFAVVFIVSLTAALPGASAASPSWGPAVRGSYLPTPDADLSLLHFTAGYRFDPVAGEPHFSAEQALPEPEGDARGYYLVQGYPPLAPDFRQFLADPGATPLRYHPQSAFIVHVDRATADALRALPEVRWVGVYQPAYRVSPLLDTSAGARREVLVQLFDDADVNLVAARLVGLGAAITTTSVTEWNLRIIAMLDGDRLAEAARTDGVDWIERWEMMYPDNHNAQWVIQTNENGNRRVWDLGLTGAGQIVSLHDTGIHTDHCMFNDPAVPITAPGDYPTHRKVIAYDLVFGTFGDNDGHGTHTSCTFAGNDESEVNTRDGMAKDARIFFTDGGVTAGGGIYTPVDLNDLFIISYTGNSAGAARITSNSWGGGGFGTYTSRSADVDEFMWNHPDYLCLFSDGNDGPTAVPPTTAA